MMYAILRGLRTEYDVLESQEFQDRVSEMAEEGEVVVDREGSEIVTDISSGEEGTTD
jgi:choline/glycine/proline betaine transport protein